MAKDIGAIDVLFNCAGYVHHGTVLDCSDQDWDFSFDLNVKSMHRTIKAFLPAMLEKGGGSIINISSGVSLVRGVPNRDVYGATKAAVIGLTKAVAATSSAATSAATRFVPERSKVRRLTIASRRWPKARGNRSRPCARPSSIASRWTSRAAREMANLALDLASDASSYTTGDIDIADGGFAL